MAFWLSRSPCANARRTGSDAPGSDGAYLRDTLDRSAASVARGCVRGRLLPFASP